MTEAVPVTGGHRHASAGAAGARRLGLVLVMVLVYLAVEVVAAIFTNSLALLADAGHMLTDAAGIGLALLAIWFAQRPATPEKSFGYYRVEIFAAIANAIILFGVAGYILYEAVQRLATPPEVIGLPMLAVAVIGLVVNLVSIRLLHAGAQSSLNLRGAYLEVIGDLLGSVAVIVAAVVISTTGWTPIDPIASVGIAGLILPRTWTLLREAVDILLQATPRGVKL
ncbi:MAG: cation diffusion facilitator family transporter, partial [Candidatus Limnocylindria bacterium]